mmetsp:Transcript_3712/g.8864  ORF Transcript_3712/g.8864 Transcript_3712/m.8864 type:complete len:349 (-) Transcript_3712:17-1063(-)|eukprot:CAMPEP_0116078058 /NCGR_PEP_ID=MMETSP0327-20121206/398_1 /TAXON_ID=44447 /ORGANISM="Pseudo-nitzschia delicatissima, Strain B596" /LENGTH=348 /DNA_ID=CAMNT_0003568575 /DNA_START=123 /DNA_END=1169 /DNA_ORIENTATION=-
MYSSGNTEEQNQPMESGVDTLPSQGAADKSSQIFGDNDANDKEKPVEVEKIFNANTLPKIDHTPSKAKARRNLDHRLPAVKSSSVFDRLYKSHTVSTKSYTLSSRTKLKPSARAKLGNRNTSQISINVEKDLTNFNRMSISRSKRVSTPHKIQGGRTSSPFSFSTPQPKQGKKLFSTNLHAPHTAPSKSSSSSTFRVTPRFSRKVYEFSPRMKPLTKLYFASRFHPGIGAEAIEPISLGYTFFQTFCEFETGGIDAEQIAKEIFIAFFKKDHSRGIRHWKIHEPVVDQHRSSPRRRCDETVYPLTMNATYAWGSTYRVAHTKGVVRFKGPQNREIYVEDFSYNLTGDA